jgi:hypothetical protein
VEAPEAPGASFKGPDSGPVRWQRISQITVPVFKNLFFASLTATASSSKISLVDTW